MLSPHCLTLPKFAKLARARDMSVSSKRDKDGEASQSNYDVINVMFWSIGEAQDGSTICIRW